MVGEGPESTAERAFYRGERTASNQILGVDTDYATISFMKLQLGRFFTEPEVSHRRRVVVLGDGPYQVLFGSKGIDPINKDSAGRDRIYGHRRHGQEAIPRQPRYGTG